MVTTESRNEKYSLKIQLYIEKQHSNIGRITIESLYSIQAYCAVPIISQAKQVSKKIW